MPPVWLAAQPRPIAAPPAAAAREQCRPPPRRPRSRPWLRLSRRSRGRRAAHAPDSTPAARTQEWWHAQRALLLSARRVPAQAHAAPIEVRGRAEGRSLAGPELPVAPAGPAPAPALNLNPNPTPKPKPNHLQLLAEANPLVGEERQLHVVRVRVRAGARARVRVWVRVWVKVWVRVRVRVRVSVRVSVRVRVRMRVRVGVRVRVRVTCGESSVSGMPARSRMLPMDSVPAKWEGGDMGRRHGAVTWGERDCAAEGVPSCGH